MNKYIVKELNKFLNLSKGYSFLFLHHFYSQMLFFNIFPSFIFVLLGFIYLLNISNFDAHIK